MEQTITENNNKLTNEFENQFENELSEERKNIFQNVKRLGNELNCLKGVPVSLTQRYTEYGFEKPDEFVKILQMMMWMKNLDWMREGIDRGQEQEDFRKNLINRDKKCVVSQKHIAKECQACHIIPYAEGGDYSINNGLLIANTFHKLFDDYIWSINPDTYTIDILCDDEEVVGSIYEYSGKKINVEPNESMKKNLSWHWNKYLEYKLESYK